MQPFDKWDVDFVGPINPPGKRTSARYIITMAYYLTIWEEAAHVVDCTAMIVERFLFDSIVTQFGCLRILMSD